MRLLYEFCGRPGVGKTFVCHRVFHALADKASPDKVMLILSSDSCRLFRSLKKLVILAYRFAGSFKRSRLILVQTVSSFSGLGWRRCVILLINLVYLDFRLSRALQRDRIVILDQGFLQLCWANLNADNCDKVKALLITLYHPYVKMRIHLVRVDAEGDVLEYRIGSRRDLNSAKGYKFKSLDIGCLQDLVQHLSAATPIEWFSIDNKVNGDACVDDLVNDFMGNSYRVVR